METGTTSSPPPAPISWQTAFWTLIPLLLNTWGQPTGRILTLCPKHTIFPRSYPFHALFDLLSITLSLLYSIFYLGISPRLAIDLLVYYRYKDCDEDNGLKAFRKWRWLRWAMFALGGAQPAIKLAAFKGLPVTKAVGMTWTVSWVVLEILGLLARDVDLGTEGEGPLTLQQHGALVASRKMRAVGKREYRWVLDILLEVMRLMSRLLCFFVIQDVLFDRRYRLSFDLTLTESGGFMWAIDFHLFVDMLRGGGPRDRVTLIGGIFFGVASMVLVSRMERQDQVVYLRHSVLYLSYVALDMVCGLPLMRRFFAFDRANCSEKCVNRVLPGIFWLLINIMFVILWYAYRYRSEGTYNPGWTSVFG